MEPDAVEIRVVGCLVEKQRTTPDAYPLSLNALRLACNQSTNRDPVVDYDEATVAEALRRLALRGWTRLASGAGSRARKYRHLLPEALGVDDGELALLAVLMLRGPQTPGELKQRSERLHGFADLARRAGDPRRAWSSAARRPPRAPAGPEGGRATSSCLAECEEGLAEVDAARRSESGPTPIPAWSPPRIASPASSANWPSCGQSWAACARRWARARRGLAAEADGDVRRPPGIAAISWVFRLPRCSAATRPPALSGITKPWPCRR